MGGKRLALGFGPSHNTTAKQERCMSQMVSLDNENNSINYRLLIPLCQIPGESFYLHYLI